MRATESAAARYGDCPTCSALLNPVGAQAFALLLADKAEFGTSRVRRWFNRDWRSY